MGKTWKDSKYDKVRKPIARESRVIKNKKDKNYEKRMKKSDLFDYENEDKLL